MSFLEEGHTGSVLLFINTKKSNKRDVTISKFKFNPETYLASFKMYVPAGIFNDFCHKNTVLHEFVHKPSKVVRQPSKN